MRPLTVERDCGTCSSDTGGQGNLRATDLRIGVVNDLQGITPPPPVVPVAVGTLTGTASLTADFEVTVTFDKAVKELVDDDFLPVGCDLVLNSLYADPAALRQPNTVWKATFRPRPNPTIPKVSVTLKQQGDNVKPAAAAESGVVEAVRKSGSLTSITVPDDANDEAAFVVTLTFASRT